MDTPLVINIDTGVISFRTEENAAQCNCRPISAKHAKMVKDGEIDIKQLLSAIKKHMMSALDFDYEKYADERRKLNVRHSALHADERGPVEDAKPDEYVTDEEIAAAAKGEVDAIDAAFNDVQRKPGRPKKVVDNTESVLPAGIFSK